MPDGTVRFKCKGKEIYHFVSCLVEEREEGSACGVGMKQGNRRDHRLGDEDGLLHHSRKERVDAAIDGASVTAVYRICISLFSEIPAGLSGLVLDLGTQYSV